MKTNPPALIAIAAIASGLLVPGFTPRAGAQSPTNTTHQAVVNIHTVDDTGSEIPVVPPGLGMPQRFDPAVFRVARSGATNIALTVFYHVGGTASNGSDYDRLGGQLHIPAGVLSADIEVAVIDDFLVEGTESVIVTVEPPVCIAIHPPPPECYLVGTGSRATAWILDNDATPPPTNNHPPTVRITAPANGATFPAPANILIAAETLDPDGYATTVEFFANNHKIGESSIVFIQEPPPGQPISLEFEWPGVPAGDYTLTARTVDNRGASGVSAPVRISVGVTNPPTNSVVTAVNIVARDAFASEGTNFFGTNNPAVFLVRRTGPTNATLTVAYSVGGTASNGVDYALIPGSVTIPAGKRTARVTIHPINDTEKEDIESVVLAVTPSASYALGSPGHAAAAIADSDHPRPPCVRLPDHLFHFCLERTNGFCFRVDASPNLVHWTPLCTNIVVDGALHFVDPDAPPHAQRFYRASPVPAFPPED